MRNWFTQYFQKQKNLNTTAQSGRLKKHLHAPYLWALDRESIARGVAAGLFAGIIPILPFQTILMIGIAILIRANLPIAFLTSWISNPITIVPLAYLTYYIGTWVLGIHRKEIALSHFSWNLDSIREAWTSFGIPFFVGLPILAIGTALLGYGLVMLIGYGSDVFKKKYRKK